MSKKAAAAPKAAAAKAAATKAAAPKAAAAPTGPREPKHSVVHRGVGDLSSAWGDASIAAASGKPRELVVKIELPELASAATIDLDITERKLCLTEPTAHYALELPLPAAVLADQGAAKFDKAKRVLSITLPVAAALAPAPKWTPASEGQSAADAEKEEAEAAAREAAARGGGGGGRGGARGGARRARPAGGGGGGGARGRAPRGGGKGEARDGKARGRRRRRREGATAAARRAGAGAGAGGRTRGGGGVDRGGGL